MMIIEAEALHATIKPQLRMCCISLFVVHRRVFQARVPVRRCALSRVKGAKVVWSRVPDTSPQVQVPLARISRALVYLTLSSTYLFPILLPLTLTKS